MSPYENVQIGNFLISIGYELKALNKSLYGSINLYQQTPNDPKLGDVFGVLNNRYFILEFKRDKGQVNSEFKKHTRNLFKQGQYESVLNISLECHLLLYPSWEQTELRFISQPFLNAIEHEQLHSVNPFEHLNSPKAFVQELFEDFPTHQARLGTNYTNFQEYLKFLSEANTNGSGSVRKSNTSGLIISINAEDEEISAFVFEDIFELNKQLNPEFATQKSTILEPVKQKTTRPESGLSM